MAQRLIRYANLLGKENIIAGTDCGLAPRVGHGEIAWAKLDALAKGAAIASLLAASTQAVAGNTEGYNPTVPQVWARNAAGNVNQVGQSITARDLSIQPTITIRPGYSVNVVVTQDIVLAPYREPGAVLGLRP